MARKKKHGAGPEYRQGHGVSARLNSSNTPAEAEMLGFLWANFPYEERWKIHYDAHPCSRRVDFHCRVLRIAIEIDGDGRAKRDRATAEDLARIEAEGWTLLRFDAKELMRDPDAAFAEVMRVALASRAKLAAIRQERETGYAPAEDPDWLPEGGPWIEG